MFFNETILPTIIGIEDLIYYISPDLKIDFFFIYKIKQNNRVLLRFKPSKIPKFPKRISNPVKQGRAFPKRLRPTQNRANKEENSEPIEIVSSDEPIFIE